ncbi:MAG TPA: hypothetical protein DCR93_37720 [Cytophagales bacterium]|nr:hypothetical protein [Cytophagales bacterium]HAP64986.1 hypothetical protein [Cytophagales bacterium]
MKQMSALLCLCVFFCQCSIDRTVAPLSLEEEEILATFQALDAAHQVQISPPDEPGQTLWLCLTLLVQESQTPLAQQSILLYHTSAAGEYQPEDPNDESTARLHGMTVSDEQGRLFVKTILPGDYGSSADNRHIHTTVANAQPEGYDIHFSQYSTFMGKNFISGSDQHFLADLKQTPGKELVTFLTLEVKKPQTSYP